MRYCVLSVNLKAIPMQTGRIRSMTSNDFNDECIHQNSSRSHQKPSSHSIRFDELAVHPLHKRREGGGGGVLLLCNLPHSRIATQIDKQWVHFRYFCHAVYLYSLIIKKMIKIALCFEHFYCIGLVNSSYVNASTVFS